MSAYAQDPRDNGRPGPGKFQCPECRHWYFESDFEGNLCRSCYEQSEQETNQQETEE
jgi:hypothetical protein